ncbi:2-C-methyl-D-erythritol 4-phosphate cytidylyltransferase [Thalassotalea euphylliae]|nr:2-C-methyl-D-erythritol 4-phosphate cytidylyltransferase [Thalassotalea euphylliae]
MNKPMVAVTAIVPAAGVGKRMQSQHPKQYLSLAGKTVIEHTLAKLLASNYVERVVVALGAEDGYFYDLEIAQNPSVITVVGGQERVDSVLAALKASEQFAPQADAWSLVHDAARPCVSTEEIDRLVETCIAQHCGGLLAAPVKDTMKRGDAEQCVQTTVTREQLWHALTPQMYRTTELIQAIEQGLANKVNITDESSAIEAAGLPSMLVNGSPNNLKITQPEDLVLAEFLLMNEQRQEKQEA